MVRKHKLFLTSFLLLSGLPALAQQNASDLTLFVGTELSRDTNLFRVDEEFQIPGGAGRGLEDSLISLFAGIDSRWVISSGSRLTFEAEIAENAYDTYSEADNTGGNVVARYDLKTTATEFQLAYTLDEERVDYANQNVPRIDFRTRQRISGNLRFHFSPRWSAAVGAGFTDIEFEVATPVERENAKFDITYASRKGNKLRLAGDYQERSNSGANSLGFEEFAVGPEIQWQISPRVKFDGGLKYQERLPEDPTLAEFDGPTGDVRLVMAASDRVEFSFAAFRRVSSLGDQLSNFAIVDGQEIRGEWKTGEKFRFFLGVSHELRDFEQEPNVIPVPGLDIREDDLTIVFTGVEWKPRESITIDLKGDFGGRSSNRDFQDFRYETYLLGFRFEFL